ncbi:MAG: Crp/Fnr family transcriptional regulator [Devosia sp.]|uniref:Crp/Fnr family transcriptional regulator n=1 Tax=Devosia sp. TaxID=1871048 RepID=UPI0024C7AD2B|nr:Crp/Fnr family transcriptional regulator [Devosia sp.]UYO01372.1 MAG: Crp/Fnr family transcriptional regulator [Devosia sp.]
MPKFRNFAAPELKFISSFKTGEMTAEAGASIVTEGTHSAHMFTVLSGWAFRFKTLEDGRRQILNYLLPGDLVGLQGSMIGELDHSVEALSQLVLCVFQRDRLFELFRNHPGLSYDVTWLAAREERMLDDHLLSVGRRTAIERAAYLLAFLNDRAASVGLGKNGKAILPLTQQHVADTLGLSIVHTNKTLRKLSNQGLIRWLERSCEILDPAGLEGLAGWDRPKDLQRPLI